MLDKTDLHRRIETPDMKDYGVYLAISGLYLALKACLVLGCAGLLELLVEGKHLIYQ